MSTATETTGTARELTHSEPPHVELKGSFELSVAQLEIVAGCIEQVLNIGSQSGGVGAGKVTFNPFSISRN